MTCVWYYDVHFEVNKRSPHVYSRSRINVDNWDARIMALDRQHIGSTRINSVTICIERRVLCSVLGIIDRVYAAGAMKARPARIWVRLHDEAPSSRRQRRQTFRKSCVHVNELTPLVQIGNQEWETFVVKCAGEKYLCARYRPMCRTKAEGVGKNSLFTDHPFPFTILP